MFYDILRFIVLFGLLYLLRFGPNKYSLILNKYNKLNSTIEDKRSIEEKYAIACQFAQPLEVAQIRDQAQDEAILKSISGYFSESDSSTIID